MIITNCQVSAYVALAVWPTQWQVSSTFSCRIEFKSLSFSTFFASCCTSSSSHTPVNMDCNSALARSSGWPSHALICSFCNNNIVQNCSTALDGRCIVVNHACFHESIDKYGGIGSCSPVFLHTHMLSLGLIQFSIWHHLVHLLVD